MSLDRNIQFNLTSIPDDILNTFIYPYLTIFDLVHPKSSSRFFSHHEMMPLNQAQLHDSIQVLRVIQSQILGKIYKLLSTKLRYEDEEKHHACSHLRDSLRCRGINRASAYYMDELLKSIIESLAKDKPLKIRNASELDRFANYPISRYPELIAQDIIYDKFIKFLISLVIVKELADNCPSELLTLPQDTEQLLFLLWFIVKSIAWLATVRGCEFLSHTFNTMESDNARQLLGDCYHDLKNKSIKYNQLTLEINKLEKHEIKSSEAVSQTRGLAP